MSFAKNEYAKTLPATVGLGSFVIVGAKFMSESQLELYAWTTTSVSTGSYVKLRVAAEPGTYPLDYLALGDSFSSGEGAGNYYEVTNFYENEQQFNLCHQSRVSYSEIINILISPVWYDSVACSGAIVEDIAYRGLNGDSGYIASYPQAKNMSAGFNFQQTIKDSMLPDYIPQLSLVKVVGPTTATMSIGGNDIGFASIITACVTEPMCYTSRDDRERVADTIARQIPRLEKTYTTLLQNMSGPNPKLYVVGYPKIVNETTGCMSFMGKSEREFANNLVDYLNAAIRIAASQAGVLFVDVTEAFVDHGYAKDYRLCGNAPLAVNGLMFDLVNASDQQPFERYMSGSYHPNALGQLLLAHSIKLITNNFTRSMPVSSVTSSLPSQELYKRLVGDTGNNVADRTEFSPEIIRDSVYDLSKSESVDISFAPDPATHLPVYQDTITAELHSDPLVLGRLTKSATGDYVGHFQLPITIRPGVHSVHLRYKDISGQQYDVVRYILIVANMLDIDGDGVSNTREQCVLGGTLGTDVDNDGTDDACDDELTTSTEEPVGIREVIDQAVLQGTATSAQVSEVGRLLGMVSHDDSSSPAGAIQQPPEIAGVQAFSDSNGSHGQSIDNNSFAKQQNIVWLLYIGGFVLVIVLCRALYRKHFVSNKT